MCISYNGHCLLDNFHHFTQHQRPHYHGHSIDGLSQLGTYNTTRRFHSQSELLRDSGEAKIYWRDLFGTAGVSSLDPQRLSNRGLQPRSMSHIESIA